MAIAISDSASKHVVFITCLLTYAVMISVVPLVQLTQLSQLTQLTGILKPLLVYYHCSGSCAIGALICLGVNDVAVNDRGRKWVGTIFGTLIGSITTLVLLTRTGAPSYTIAILSYTLPMALSVVLTIFSWCWYTKGYVTAKAAVAALAPTAPTASPV